MEPCRRYQQKGSAAGIGFNMFLFHTGGIVFVCWLITLFSLKFLYKKELEEEPQKAKFNTEGVIRDSQTLRRALFLPNIFLTSSTYFKYNSNLQTRFRYL